MGQKVITPIITSVAVLGLMITNPNKENYSDFISKHIKRSLCDETEMPQSLKSLCSMITRPIAKTVINQATDRTNLILMSYYETDIIGTKFETIAIGGFFFFIPNEH